MQGNGTVLTRASSSQLWRWLIPLASLALTIRLLTILQFIPEIPPRTIVSHIRPVSREPERGVLFLTQVEKLLPTGSTVRIAQARNGVTTDDPVALLVAAGQLPRQRVVRLSRLRSSDPREYPEFIASLGGELRDPRYVLVASFREGSLYRIIR